MKEKNQTYSIYLLKEGYSDINSIRESSKRIKVKAKKIPKGGSLYYFSTPSTDPWWKEYWGADFIEQQKFLGAIAFIPYKKKGKVDRLLAITYGYGFTQLKEESYEYDFGLLVTLNAIDPKQLSSIDKFMLETAKRERTQASTAQDITFFDIDNDTTMIRSFTGITKKKYLPYMKHVTGCNNVRVMNTVKPGKMNQLFDVLMELYSSNNYKKSFPNINSIKPEKDPIIEKKLISQLITGFTKKTPNIELAFPEIISFDDYSGIKYFLDDKSSGLFENLNISDLYEFFEKNKIDEINTDVLNRTEVKIIGEDNKIISRYSILKCVLYSQSEDSKNYYLAEGQWYKLDTHFISQLTNQLDKHFYVNPDFPEFDSKKCREKKEFTISKNKKQKKSLKSEGEYNKNISLNSSKYICLDKSQLEGKIEPCDICSVEYNKANFYHIKIGDSSSKLSHLFNQGYVSVKLLKREQKEKEKIKGLLDKKKDKNNSKIVKQFKEEIDKNTSYIVHYGIITTKEIDKKSENLPLFSQITLLRVIKDLEMLGTEVKVFYIKEI